MDSQAPTGDDEAERLRQLIQVRLGGRVRGFRVLARDGGIVLRGEAGSYYLKQMVQEAVIGATSSRVVANEIVVG